MLLDIYIYIYIVFDTSLLNTRQYKVRIKGKVENPEKGVVPSPTLRCSSYRKGSVRVALYYFTYLLTIYVNIYKIRN